MRRGLRGQSRTSGCAAGCREGIYCCGRHVCSWLLVEDWVAEEGQTEWQEKLVLCVDGMWQMCCDSGILLGFNLCGCLIVFLKDSHFIFYADKGRVCSGEDIQLSFLAESTDHEPQWAVSPWQWELGHRSPSSQGVRTFSFSKRGFTGRALLTIMEEILTSTLGRLHQAPAIWVTGRKLTSHLPLTSLSDFCPHP